MAMFQSHFIHITNACVQLYHIPSAPRYAYLYITVIPYEYRHMSSQNGPKKRVPYVLSGIFVPMVPSHNLRL